MREIKFRAWFHGGGDPRVESAMKFSHPFPVMFWDNIERWDLSVEVMQFTGLKDKNDVEIYEGDIVDSIIDGESDIFEIAFTVDRDFNGWEITPQHIEDGLEIIGNIYENPELLEREKE